MTGSLEPASTPIAGSDLLLTDMSSSSTLPCMRFVGPIAVHDGGAQGMDDVMKLSVRVANYRHCRASRWADLQRSAVGCQALGLLCMAGWEGCVRHCE